MSQELISDLFNIWETDLQASNTGDLLTVEGSERGKQRILRRLMTNPGDYIFEPDYGAGLPLYVGQALDSALFDSIYGIIRSQIFMEACVSKTPQPVIDLKQLADFSLWVWIQYTDAPTQTSVVLNFTAS